MGCGNSALKAYNIFFSGKWGVGRSWIIGGNGSIWTGESITQNNNGKFNYFFNGGFNPNLYYKWHKSQIELQ